MQFKKNHAATLIELLVVIAILAAMLLPAHKSSTGPLPTGGNEVFIDGSARWIKARTMLFIHFWSTARPLYCYQEDLGVLEPQRSKLAKV